VHHFIGHMIEIIRLTESMALHICLKHCLFSGNLFEMNNTSFMK